MRETRPCHWCMDVCVVIDPGVLAVSPNKHRKVCEWGGGGEGVGFVIPSMIYPQFSY